MRGLAASQPSLSRTSTTRHIVGPYMLDRAHFNGAYMPDCAHIYAAYMPDCVV
jgi:hypothetical protein